MWLLTFIITTPLLSADRFTFLQTTLLSRCLDHISAIVVVCIKTWKHVEMHHLVWCPDVLYIFVPKQDPARAIGVYLFLGSSWSRCLDEYIERTPEPHYIQILEDLPGHLAWSASDDPPLLMKTRKCFHSESNVIFWLILFDGNVSIGREYCFHRNHIILWQTVPSEEVNCVRLDIL